MNAIYTNVGTQAYQQVNRYSAIEGASPHQLVCMLLKGAIDNIAAARGFMQRRDFSNKGKSLNKTIAIITELKSSLDMKKGKDIAANLNRLYDYILHLLLNASAENNQGQLIEASDLLLDLLESWNGIPIERRNG